MKKPLAIFCLISLLLPLSVRAQEPSAETISAVVWVQCDERQGSGTIIDSEARYVLTNGHVVIDALMGNEAEECVVGLADPVTFEPNRYYRANVVDAVFNTKLNQDFAVLQITQPTGQFALPSPLPFLKTNEFIQTGDIVHLLGYSGSNEELLVRSGNVENFLGGFVQTSAEIFHGDSGGAAVDEKGNLIGVPTRIVTTTSLDGQSSTTTFELVDIRSVMNWLDTSGENVHDLFFTHADYARFHSTAGFIQQTDLGCEALGRSPEVSAVYCLLPDGQRLAFPNDLTFFSWFDDFTSVTVFEPEEIADYRLTRNVTFRPGTLVKSASSPSVYVVSDSFGALRWIPSEQKAVELWGENWASLVFDIPDEFWTNYEIGSPIEG